MTARKIGFVILGICVAIVLIGCLTAGVAL
jgi:hypothetical protein